MNKQTPYRKAQPPDKVIKKAHYLTLARRGRNRFQTGAYVCACGHMSTNILKFEAHRADENRKAKGVNNDV